MGGGVGRELVTSERTSRQWDAQTTPHDVMRELPATRARARAAREAAHSASCRRLLLRPWKRHYTKARHNATRYSKHTEETIKTGAWVGH